MTMKVLLKETLAELESLGNEKVRAHNKKYGAGDDQFAVRLGDIRKLAKKIKTHDRLAIALWSTENIDARLLAILLIKPESLSREEMDRIVRSVNFSQVADWLNSYVVKNHPDKLSPASQARHCHRRRTGRLSRLSGVEGLHLAVRSDLDQ